MKLHDWLRRTNGREEPFCEIDAKEFEEARRDPKVKAMLKAADAHMAKLRREGRIDG